MSFFRELQRRNVVRMAIPCAAASWLILQIADVLFDQLQVPPRAFRLVLGPLLLESPFVLIFSRVYEFTPERIRRGRDVSREQPVMQQTGHRINITIIALLALAICGLIADCRDLIE